MGIPANAAARRHPSDDVSRAIAAMHSPTKQAILGALLRAEKAGVQRLRPKDISAAIGQSQPTTTEASRLLEVALLVSRWRVTGNHTLVSLTPAGRWAAACLQGLRESLTTP